MKVPVLFMFLFSCSLFVGCGTPEPSVPSQTEREQLLKMMEEELANQGKMAEQGDH